MICFPKCGSATENTIHGLYGQVFSNSLGSNISHKKMNYIRVLEWIHHSHKFG